MLQHRFTIKLFYHKYRNMGLTSFDYHDFDAYQFFKEDKALSDTSDRIIYENMIIKWAERIKERRRINGYEHLGP